MPTYKSTADIETFIDRFEQFCITQNVAQISKANMLMSALDDATFNVVKRELTIVERTDYDTVRQHLLKRFDTYRESGQRRLMFRQAKRDPAQSFEEFYTSLLELASKAFPGDTGVIIDRMITDQFMVGCSNDKIRLYLIEKAPTSSRDALSLALAHQAALNYNESLKDTPATIATTAEVNKSSKSKARSSSPGNWRRNNNNNYRQRSSRTWQQNTNYNGWQGYKNSYNGKQFSYNNRPYRNETNYNRRERETYGNQQYQGQRRGNGRGYRGRQQVRFEEQRNSSRESSKERETNGKYTSSAMGNPACPFYVQGMFNKVEISILIDTGSAVTIIDEELWSLIKQKDEKLNKVPFAIRSVTQHTVEVMGEKEIYLELCTKRKHGVQAFKIKTLIAKGLVHKAVIGIDFLKRYSANMDIENEKLLLYNKGMKTRHKLIQGQAEQRSVNIIIKEQAAIEGRTEKRVECYVQDDLEDGTVIYFSPSSEFLSSKPIWLAGVVDTVRDGKITVQFVNTTEERVTIPPDSMIGCVDVIPESELNISATTTLEKNTTDWLKNIDIGNDNIGGGERQRIRELLQEYKDVFSQHENDLGRTNLIQHSIEIVGEKPRRCGPRALNPNMRKELEKQVNDMLTNDLIQPSTSEYASPVVLVKKKDGSIRFCCDFRKLNAASRRDSYPLPRISEVISTLAGAKVFSTLDLKSGYYQIGMKPEDREKNSFYNAVWSF